MAILRKIRITIENRSASITVLIRLKCGKNNFDEWTHEITKGWNEGEVNNTGKRDDQSRHINIRHTINQ